jgi:hypothetical protein
MATKKRVGITGTVEFFYKFDREELENILGCKPEFVLLEVIANHIASYIDPNPLGGLQYDDQGYIKIVPINFKNFDKMMEFVINDILVTS